jgi:hypothetical protein
MNRIADATPATRYTPPPRPYPCHLPPLEYPGHYEVRRMSGNGGICWYKQWVNVSGLTGIEDGEWELYFGPCASATGTNGRCRWKTPWARPTADPINPCHPCPAT